MTRQQTPPALAAGGSPVYLCLDHPHIRRAGDEWEGMPCAGPGCGRELTLVWNPNATVFEIIAGLAQDVSPEVITAAPYGGFTPAPVPRGVAGKLDVVRSLVRDRAKWAGFVHALPDALVIADGKWAISLFGGEVGPVSHP